MGGDADRAVEAESSGPAPAEHVVGLIPGQQPPAYVEAEDATLDDGREAAGGLGVESAGRVKGQGVVVPPGEQPIGDGEVEVGMGVELQPLKCLSLPQTRGDSPSPRPGAFGPRPRPLWTGESGLGHTEFRRNNERSKEAR